MKWVVLNSAQFEELPNFRHVKSICCIDGFASLHGRFFGGRHCHGGSEAFSYCRRRRLGLRIISSKSNAEEQHIGKGKDQERNRGYAAVKYSVIRINIDGTWEPVILNMAELGVHAKDLDLLAGNFYIPKRSAIAIRDDQILIRMENVRALVRKNYCLLFDAHRPRRSSFKLPPLDGEGVKQSASETSHQAREAFAIFMAEHAKQLVENSQDQVPFHLRMIECLLDGTCNFFHQKVERLKLVSERRLEELTNDVDMGGLQRLLPLKRALTEVEHDVRDTHEAMEQVLSSDDMLDALCLKGEGQQSASQGETQRTFINNEHHGVGNKARQAAANIILSYQREIDDAGGALEEMRKDMDAAQEVWELGLDITRNRIITMNLYISIATVSFSLAAVPASFFGMNLSSGLENHPQMFCWVMGATSTVALTCLFGLIFAFRIWPNFKDKRRAQDLAALRDLLQHMDVIDDIIQSAASQGKGNRMSRQEFEKILQDHSSTQFIGKKELDLIFRMFDGNLNGFLEAGEWNVFPQRRVRQKVAQNFGRDL